ncbi:MAG: citramalate synthase [Nitrospirae bacterium]|nr:citramalate synthase [Nitrospirota bacterium]
MNIIEIYDTTLRDGSQSEDISLSIHDKLRITEKLDELGVQYIEGGWPMANPKDEAYFQKVKKLTLKNATITAFGSTHKPGLSAQNDPNLLALLKAGTNAVCIFGKTWDFHVEAALRIPLSENIEIIFNSITFLKKNFDKVFFDCEHFFDGYKRNPQYALQAIKAAEQGGANCLVLCDTNGGCLPFEIGDITEKILKEVNIPIGIHAHNDSDCAVANTIMAVRSGATHVQGTINGLGERCGNANICSIIPNLQHKLGYDCIGADKLKKIKEVSHYINEVANLQHHKRQPYVGDSAFAHKAGIHVSAIMKNPETYEHMNPELVGNSQRILVSELSGKSNIIKKAEELGITASEKLLEKLKNLESKGFVFEGADASFELLTKKTSGEYVEPFEFLGFRVFVDKRSREEDSISDATIMVKFPDGNIVHTAARGDGPVNALDTALRKAIERFYPELKQVKLKDYKVRLLEAGVGTATKVRVLIESGDENSTWNTVGVSENVIDASWQALIDSIEYKLLKQEITPLS